MTKATCPRCGRAIGRMRSGKFRRHVAKLGEQQDPCQGSWRWLSEIKQEKLYETSTNPDERTQREVNSAG